MRNTVFVATLLFLWVVPAISAERWSLEKVVSRAVEQAPIIRAYNKEVERVHFAALQAGRWSNPDFTFAMGPVTQAGVLGHSLDLSLKQSIPLFGQKSIAEKLGRQQEKTVEIDAGRERLRLEHRVVQLAYRYLVASEIYKHVEHRRKKIDLILKFLNSRPFASPAQSVERDLIRYRIREIEENVLDMILAKESAWKALNVYLGLSDPIVVETGWSSGERTINREYFEAQFVSQNPDLRYFESLIATSGVELELASKKKWPDFRVGAIYSEQTADLPQRLVMGSLEMSLPIWDRGGYLRDSISANKEALGLKLLQNKLELASRFEQSWLKLENSREKLKLYPKMLLSELEEQMTAAEQHWKRGLISVAVFLEMENQVHRQTDRVYEVQNSYIEALSELELLAGVSHVH